MQTENPLGSRPLPQLLASFAIPSILAMLVSSLYNIVDQIFIGQGVGYLGNAATNVAYPLSTICLAIALLIGVGSAASVMPYALTYTRITAVGMPLLILTNAISNLIRADGSPRFSMVCMLLGAIINTILDPVFIFLCHWGVAGAAWATVIGQAARLNPPKNREAPTGASRFCFCVTAAWGPGPCWCGPWPGR